MQKPSAARQLAEDDAVPVPAGVVPAWRRKRRRQPVAESAARRLVERSQTMRFDCEARVEVFLEQDEIEDEYWKQLDVLKASAEPEDQKIAKVKQLALELAMHKISEQSTNGVDITADIGLANINVDSIDWVALVSKPEEEESEDELERAPALPPPVASPPGGPEPRP